MLGRADPVGVDRLHVVGIGLAAPAEQELLGGRLALGDDVVRSRLAPVVDGRRLGDDRHHLRRKAGQVVARLGVVDVDELLELPDAGQPRGLGLEVGRRVPRQARGLVRLRVGHSRFQALVDEQAPDLLVGNGADELLDIDAAIPRAPPSRSGSAISVWKATTPSSPGLKSFICLEIYR